MPLLVISSYANFGRIGGSSPDALAGSTINMFEFENGGDARKLFLDPESGLPQSI